MITGEQIDRAARLIYQLRHPEGDPIGGVFEGPSWAEIEMRDAQATARALAEAGLLAPAPLTEEWATRFENGLRLPGRERKYGRWCKGDPPKGVNVRRYVTDWLPVDRAEGDGRAE